jgi:hypothetical protein
VLTHVSSEKFQSGTEDNYDSYQSSNANTTERSQLVLPQKGRSDPIEKLLATESQELEFLHGLKTKDTPIISVFKYYMISSTNMKGER